MTFTSSRTTRWSDVYIIVGSRLFTSTGTFGSATALLLKLQTGGMGGLAAAALIITTALPQVVLAPITGRIADRFDSRWIIVIAGAVESVACLALAQASALPALLPLVFLTASAGAQLQPTYGGLIPSIVSKDDLARSSALGQTAASIGMFVGPALAGVLVGGFGVAAALYVNAGTALATVAAGLLVRTRRGGRHRRDIATPDRARWRLSGDPLLQPLMIGLAILVIGMSSVNVAEVFFIRETLGASETMYGFVTGCWAGGMLAGAWALAKPIRGTARDGRLARWLLWLLAGAVCVMFAIGVVTGTAWPLPPLFLLGGAFNGGLNTLISVLFARRVPERGRGRAYAFLGAITQGGSLIGYGLGGVGVDLLSPRGVLLAAAGATAVTLPVVVALVRRPIAADLEPGPGTVGTGDDREGLHPMGTN